eukprot:TRINITY_DN23921_c0_g3_i1.p2 TRINITY_DN23921_c0_g3~~TRINITY_DN23921_c0_g3_i1.p2  ORF type:complete len:116 (-),score=22.69 TRINITY_DN23921_c0_g3_i1:200-547(-)
MARYFADAKGVLNADVEHHLNECMGKCWNTCNERCIVDEDEIEIIGSYREGVSPFSSCRFSQGCVSAAASAICTPLRTPRSAAPATATAPVRSAPGSVAPTPLGTGRNLAQSAAG